MRHMLLYLFIVFATTPLLCNGIFEEIPPGEASGRERILAPSSDISDLISSNALALDKLSLPSERSKAKAVFVVDESALSNAMIDLENLFKKAEGKNLTGSDNLAGLYSELGYASSVVEIPSRQFKYEPQMPQLPGDSVESTANDIIEQPQYYFEPEPPIYDESGLPWSNERSIHGVTAIWNL
jgi:hypothetical protein